MTASLQDIKGWFEEGKKDPKNTHMIVAHDTFDHDNYPVYVKEGQDPRAIIKERYSGQNMQSVDEVYSYKLSWQEQSKGRVYNL